MVYIACFTELNLQICDYAQKRRIYRENGNYTPDENFCGHFCLRRKASNFCQADRRLPLMNHLNVVYGCRDASQITELF